KRRVEGLVKNHTTDELHFAASLAGPSKSSTEEKSLSLLQTFALYLDLNLSVRKYNCLRSVVNSLHKDTFPSMYKLNLFKSQFLCELTHISDTIVEVNIQDMIDKTMYSITQLVDENVNIESENLILISKWGMDGSSGHSTYKQKFLQ